jgi:hypothetical protein
MFLAEILAFASLLCSRCVYVTADKLIADKLYLTPNTSGGLQPHFFSISDIMTGTFHRLI